MLWFALLLPPQSVDEAYPSSQQQAMALWALQFTPRVALLEEAVVFEAHASQRLFGGREALIGRVLEQSAELGCLSTAYAPTALAALALARDRQHDGFSHPLVKLLDSLPLDCLRALADNSAILARIGCRTIGDVRKLPRGGLNRRFHSNVLTTLDQAYGSRPESFEWVAIPDTFEARIELSGRVENAQALMAGAWILLKQMAGWLAARHVGVRQYTFGWAHDALRSKHVQAHGELVIRTAETTRNVQHLGKLLEEQLAGVELEAPVGDLSIKVNDIEVLEDVSESLLLDTALRRDPLHELIERLSARLGPERVQRPVMLSDHRLEWMQAWQPAGASPPRTEVVASPEWPQPAWLLPEPIALAVRGDKPHYQGQLDLLAGPHRIESAWWDRVGGARVAADEAEKQTEEVERDYYIAASPQAGLLMVYRHRLPTESGGGTWFLHGFFA